jgi:putative ABC transport system permease protein
MTEGGIVRANLWRHPVRTLLLTISIFIAFLVFGLLVGANQAMENSLHAAGANRLAVTDRINVSSPQPYAHFPKVRQVPGVIDATFTKWFGGYYSDPRNTLTTFAVDPESFARVNGDRYRMSPEAWRAFESDRTGIVLSAAAAERNNLHIGQRIPLSSNIFTNKSTGGTSWDFTVRGIWSGSGYGAALIHHEYFRETATFSADTVDVIIAVTRDAAENDAIARRIDAAFANSSNETKTQDESVFNRAFLQQYGDLALVITLVVSAAFAAILFVVGNTMVLAVRERTKEIGVLKTLGFSSGRILRMILSESLFLSLAGAVAGLGAAAFALAALAPSVRDTIGDLNMPPLVGLTGLAIAIVFGLGTGFAPAFAAYRLKIIDAFASR